MNLREKAQLAEKAARAAGEMLLNCPRVAAVHKAENDFVTEMDLFHSFNWIIYVSENKKADFTGHFDFTIVE